jgi:hypothetical protein
MLQDSKSHASTDLYDLFTLFSPNGTEFGPLPRNAANRAKI